MDFVALISGGKDSVYNMIECIRLGHRPVCLANLHPPVQEVGEELDSWMYQTVGWNVVPLLSESMGLPLIHRPTSGLAKHTGITYPASVSVNCEESDDEVEDLYRLLQDVLVAHPTVKGVAVGAILSTYQRVRVESVCARLGLVPMAMLWQREQGGLLEDMAASGLQALLIKVATHGLSAEQHLGKDVMKLIPLLTRLNATLGLHVCGEGGEYETLTVDSPLHTHGCIALDSTSVVRTGGGTAHMRVASAKILADEKDVSQVAHLLHWNWRSSGTESRDPPPPLPPYVNNSSSTGTRVGISVGGTDLTEKIILFTSPNDPPAPRPPPFSTN